VQFDRVAIAVVNTNHGNDVSRCRSAMQCHKCPPARFDWPDDRKESSLSGVLIFF
jgi:hypothetical protein